MANSITVKPVSRFAFRVVGQIVPMLNFSNGMQMSFFEVDLQGVLAVSVVCGDAGNRRLRKLAGGVVGGWYRLASI